MSDFKPVVGGAEPRRKWFRPSRSVIVMIVVGAHVVAGALFAIPVIQRVIGDLAPPEAVGPPVTMVDMVISEQNDEASRVAANAKNRPPVLKPAKLDSPADRAKSAGVPLTGPANALLLVRVSEQGRPDDVAVVESSGDVRLDQVAVEYARALEWTPAVVAGRATTMSIRLPVEFEVGG